jgi:prepilin-type N-terminal cleavage/methylation domain-containing protein
MKTSETDRSGRRALRVGFTLLELIIVLVIISGMMTVILPYATRSNAVLRMEQECLNIAQAVEYAMSLCADTKRPTRLIVNIEERSYSVEIASEFSSRHFLPTEDAFGKVRYVGRDINVTDLDGFDVEDKGYLLLFDPAGVWPEATISLAAGETLRTIKINGKRVEIENSTI